MYDYLKILKAKNTLCEIYDDINDNESYYLGYILAYDENTVLIESVSTNGTHDGYYCLLIEDIFEIRKDTNYIKNCLKLMGHNAFKRKKLSLDDKDVLNAFLQHIKTGKLLCSIELLNSADLSGYIETVNSEIAEINLVDENGQPDGNSIIRISDITYVSAETVALNKLKIFSDKD